MGNLSATHLAKTLLPVGAGNHLALRHTRAAHQIIPSTARHRSAFDGGSTPASTSETFGNRLNVSSSIPRNAASFPQSQRLGTRWPCSHALNAVRATPTRTAASVWVRPAVWRRYRRCSGKVRGSHLIGAFFEAKSRISGPAKKGTNGLDYALWFDFLLPGLDRLGVPMPLGGTSNHFRTRCLREIHGWDPYNVTEDADLGIRLAQMGYRVATLDSTTFEEATNQLDNWLRQRSRWLKGYMQTWLVHMRDPRALIRNAGWKGFLGFQLFIGGTILTTLFNPVLWALSFLLLMPGIPGTPDVFGFFMPHASFLSIIAGNALFTYLAMLGPYRRGWLALSPYGLAAPFYWLLISLAGYRGAWQLVTKPWHWEKTRHGTTKMSAAA